MYVHCSAAIPPNGHALQASESARAQAEEVPAGLQAALLQEKEGTVLLEEHINQLKHGKSWSFPSDRACRP